MLHSSKMFPGVHYLLLLCFQLEKYQDVIKATEEFETKLVSIGMWFEIVWLYLARSNLRFDKIVTKLFQFRHYWKKWPSPFLYPNTLKTYTP